MVIRSRIYAHLRAIVPKFADVVDLYSTPAFYAAKYGMDEHGTFAADHVPPPDDEDQDADSDLEGDTPITAYKSRRLLI